MERVLLRQLELLAGEEETLLETVEGLKETLLQASRLNGSKVEEIRKLTRTAEDLKNGRKQKSASAKLKKDVQNKNEVEGVQGFGKDAATVFSEEVWEIIFRNVPDPKDLWNLCNTCPLFQTILFKWKSGWMLGKALPYIYKDLPGDKLLECRLVSKSWKGAVDNFLESHPSNQPYNTDSASLDPREVSFVNPMAEKGLRANTFSFRSLHNSSILEDPRPQTVCKTVGLCPFVGRRVSLTLGGFTPSKEKENEDIDKFLEKIRQYLTRFGKEIWYLNVWLPGIHGFHVTTVPLLHRKSIQFITMDMLPLVPNLRELGLAMSITAHDHVDPLSDIYTLPPAPKLETLQVSYICNPADSLVGVLMQKYHCQLRKLCTSTDSISFPELCRLDWPNLTELHLTSIARPSLLGGLDGAKMPQLSKLGLNLVDIEEEITFDELFTYIRQLSTTTPMNTVRLEQGSVWLPIGHGQFAGIYTEPSSIKTLEVDMGHWDWEEKRETPPSFTFLLKYFPFVENVHLFWKKDYNMSDPEIAFEPRNECLKLAVEMEFEVDFEVVEVNKYVYRGQMYKSNIWELLHQLKVFTFQWDVYSREGYEEYQERCKIHSANGNGLSVD